MEAAQILDRLTFQERLPVEALREATADRALIAPVFVHAIEQYVSPGGDRSAQDSLFFIFHLLGEWREKSAYRPLARLLRCAPDDVEAIFGGAVTETTHRVMAAVFDGDPGPLYEVILAPAADEFIRSRMLEAVAMVTLRSEMPREEAARFLRACYSELDPQDECWVWNGWQSAIALLGLVELKPLVEQAFERGFISRTWMRLHHFEEDLRQAIDDPASWSTRSDREFSLFGDTVEELSTWYCFRPKEPEPAKRKEFHRGTALWRTGTAVNPHRKVGRNDPCPCGSGRKFKKCCLPADLDLTTLQAPQGAT
jgi:uncharacterized protein YchJ